MIDVFLQTCDWLEDRVVQSLRDFMEKMREYAGKVDLEVYDKRYIKVITETLCKTLHSLRKLVSQAYYSARDANVLNKRKYAETKTNIDEEKRRIITMAVPPR